MGERPEAAIGEVQMKTPPSGGVRKSLVGRFGGAEGLEISRESIAAQ